MSKLLLLEDPRISEEYTKEKPDTLDNATNKNFLLQARLSRV